MKFNKKAFEFSSRKFIQLMILLVVFFFLATYSGNLYGKVHDGLFDMKFSSEEKKCELNSESVNVISCEYNLDCTDEDKKKWEEYKKYLGEVKICDNFKNNEVGVEPGKACTCLQNVIWNKNREVLVELNQEKDEQFKQSGQIITSTDLNKVYSSSEEMLSTFSKENKVSLSKLKAFIEVESGKKPFDSSGHPTVRFECLKFNTQVDVSKRVKCNTDKYKYGNFEDTNKEAFLRALEIDKNLAIRVTSFGMGQVLGDNYKMCKYSSEEDFYKAMYVEENQVKVFLQFILYKNGGIILKELQKENTDWAIVAKNYNGGNYKDNNYDVKLASAESKFSSSIG